jgi:AcrR family transcriptional regulator
MPRALTNDAQVIGNPAFDGLPAAKREAIYAAAVEEFAERGYRGASMNTLARQAGIAKGSVFFYFRSKSALFDALVEVAVSRVKGYLKGVRDATADRDLCGRLEELARAGFLFIDAHPKLAMIYFRLLHSGDAPLGREQLAYLRGRSQRFLVELLSEARERGEIRADLDLRHVAFMLDAMLERMLRAYDIEHLDPDHGLDRGRERTREDWIASFVQFVRHGLAVGASRTDDPHAGGRDGAG